MYFFSFIELLSKRKKARQGLLTFILRQAQEVGTPATQTNLSRKGIEIIASTLLPYCRILNESIKIRLEQLNDAFSTKVKKTNFNLLFR